MSEIVAPVPYIPLVFFIVIMQFKAL